MQQRNLLKRVRIIKHKLAQHEIFLIRDSNLCYKI